MDKHSGGPATQSGHLIYFRGNLVQSLLLWYTITVTKKLPANQFLLDNMGLLKKIAYRVLPDREDPLYQDIVQELCLATLELYPKWDPSRGKFSTFAFFPLVGVALKTYRGITLPISFPDDIAKRKDHEAIHVTKDSLYSVTEGECHIEINLDLEYFSNLTKAEKQAVRHVVFDRGPGKLPGKIERLYNSAISKIRQEFKDVEDES